VTASAILVNVAQHHDRCGRATFEYTGLASEELQDLLLITRFADEVG